MGRRGRDFADKGREFVDQARDAVAKGAEEARGYAASTSGSSGMPRRRVARSVPPARDSGVPHGSGGSGSTGGSDCNRS